MERLAAGIDGAKRFQYNTLTEAVFLMVKGNVIISQRPPSHDIAGVVALDVWRNIIDDTKLSKAFKPSVRRVELQFGIVGTLFDVCLGTDAGYAPADRYIPPGEFHLFCSPRVSTTPVTIGERNIGGSAILPGMCPHCGKPGPFVNFQMVCPEHGPYGG